MTHLKKTVSLLLCAMLLIAMIPMASLSANAADTITVYFADNAGFGTPNCYYWEGGAQWPGKAMTYVENNDYGEKVYSATIPANITGIVFNGSGKQTVDITTGIKNGMQWYTTGQQDGQYTVGSYQRPNPTPAPTVAPTQAPTQKPTQAPTQAPTAAPSNTITVYFADNAGFGTPNCYYWEGGAQWPGKAMTYVENNDYGEKVYSATIPADITGIVFNGSGKQTVDITTGIKNGMQWYTTGQQDGQYTVGSYQRPNPTPAPTVAPTQAPTQKPTQAPTQAPTQKPTVKPTGSITILRQPADAEVANGKTASFSVAAQGNGLTYNWYYRPAGKTNWINTNVTEATYSIKMTAARDGREVYCKIADANGNTVSSDTAVMKMMSAPALDISQPQDWYGTDGELAWFNVGIDGTGEGISYQWFYRKSSTGNWIYANKGLSTPNYQIEMTPARAGRQVYCRITDEKGNVTNSEIATMRYQDILITQQPETWLGYDGDDIEIPITAVSTSGRKLTYQWYYQNDMTWIKVPDTDNVYSGIKMAPKYDGKCVMCVVSDGIHSVESTPAYIFYGAEPSIKITEQPHNWYGPDHAVATFRVIAEGNDLTYQWFYRASASSDWVSADIPSQNYYSITMTPEHEGVEAFCRVSDADGNHVDSDIAFMKHLPFLITEQPQDWYGDDGDEIEIPITADKDHLTYQWYYWREDKNKWIAAPDYDNTYSGIIMEKKFVGRRVKCVISDGDYSTESYEATIHYSTDHFSPNVYFSQEPKNWFGKDGDPIEIKTSVITNGDEPTYQWYYWKNGLNKWVKAPDTDDTYSGITMEKKYEFRRVRCEVTSSGETVTSEEAVINYAAEPVPTPGDNKTLFFCDASDCGFGTPYLYYYNDNAEDPAYPGVSMTYVGTNSQGKDIYSAVMPDGFSYFKFISNNGNATAGFHRWYSYFDVDNTLWYTTGEPYITGECCMEYIENYVPSANLTYTPPVEPVYPVIIMRQPQEYFGTDGWMSRIYVNAVGTGVTYKWFYCDAGETEWIETDDHDAVYDIVMSPAVDGRQVYCELGDALGNTVNTQTAVIRYFKNSI
ncbi:starch-binding protein [Ruminococcus sp.]|uniref:starch-binding protein n=1 Tax=Ruminococcus sp. TaxID=41978 RepID=UPI00388EBAAD